MVVMVMVMRREVHAERRGDFRKVETLLPVVVHICAAAGASRAYCYDKMAPAMSRASAVVAAAIGLFFRPLSHQQCASVARHLLALKDIFVAEAGRGVNDGLMWNSLVMVT